ncbi:MAG: hypothetical protein CL908_24265 [Deltaproteobacteria bacterium]|jgi:hypothetical protein|nr:hypothetical protein [Deltaproteobacteria bacterium]
MSEYVIGVANILGGLFFQALITGKFSRTEASLEYWSDWRTQHPAFCKYGPSFLVAFGAIRIAVGLLG